MNYEKEYGLTVDEDGNVLGKSAPPVKAAKAPTPRKNTLKETYEAMMPAATDALWEIINDSDAPHSARMTAIMEVANRHVGKQAATAEAGEDKKLDITIMHQCYNCQKVSDGIL